MLPVREITPAPCKVAMTEVIVVRRFWWDGAGRSSDASCHWEASTRLTEKASFTVRSKRLASATATSCSRSLVSITPPLHGKWLPWIEPLKLFLESERVHSVAASSGVTGCSCALLPGPPMSRSRAAPIAIQQRPCRAVNKPAAKQQVSMALRQPELRVSNSR